jgi:hypothetical protein
MHHSLLKLDYVSDLSSGEEFRRTLGVLHPTPPGDLCHTVFSDESKVSFAIFILYFRVFALNSLTASLKLY